MCFTKTNLVIVSSDFSIKTRSVDWEKRHKNRINNTFNIVIIYSEAYVWRELILLSLVNLLYSVWSK